MEALELRLLPLGMGWVFRRASIQEHDGDPIIPIAPVLKAKYDYSVIARWEYDNPNCFVLKVFPKKSRPTEVMEAHVLNAKTQITSP